MKVRVLNSGIRVLYVYITRDKDDVVEVYLTPHSNYDGFKRVVDREIFDV